MNKILVLRRAVFLFPLFLSAACGDLPTSAPPLEVTSAPFLSGECVPNDDGVFICPPISGGGGECDVYHYDCGGDDCMSSVPGGNPDDATLQGCYGAGGGGGAGTGGGGGGSGGGGSGGGTSPGEPVCPDAECSEPPTNAPEGIDQAFFEGLNPEERRLCWRSPTECWNVKSAADYSFAWAAAEEPTGAHNGPQDALRHAMWNARMTQMMGPDRARAWANAHESSSTNPDETRMDLHNNAAGRDVGRF